MGVRYFEYILQDNNSQSIALPQSVLVANNPTRSLILNGVLGNNNINSTILNFNGFSQYITLYSGSDLSQITFTITGYQNSKLITEKLSGPNGTVEDTEMVLSKNLYDSVISISTNADIVGQVSVGTLTYVPNVASNFQVFSNPIMIDFPYRKGINCIVSVSGRDNKFTFNDTYTLYCAMGNIIGNGKTISEMMGDELIEYPEQFTKNEPFININVPFRYIVVGITPAIGTFPDSVIRFSQNN